MKWLAALLATASLPAQQVFAPLERNHLQPDPGPTVALVALDIDRDGAIDLLLREATGVQSWYRNDAHAAFSRQPPLSLGGDLRAAPAVADVDGDLDADLLLGGVLHRNAGPGNFVMDGAALPAAVAGGDLPRFVDLDRDGDLDLLLRMAVTQYLRALQNDGTGHFTDVSAAVLPVLPGAVADLACTDADRDGDVDVLVAFTGGNTQLLRNAGSGTFTAHVMPAVAPGTVHLSCGDLDQDGDDDLLAGGQLLQNDGLGNYGPVALRAWVAPLVPLGSFGRGELRDLDQDGLADLVDVDAANGYFQNVGLFGTSATWNFFEVWFPAFPWGAGPRTWVDLDGDLDLDAVAAGDRVRVLLHSNGAFFDGVQQPVVTAPFRAAPLDEADARGDDGPLPFVEIAYLDQGTARLLSSRYPPVLPEIAGAFADLFLPPIANATSVALCDLTGLRAYSLVACTPQGARLCQRVATNTLYDVSAALQVGGTAVFVQCADLFGGPQHELVFGATGIAGPQIVAIGATGALLTSIPALPPPNWTNHALHELVRLADFDGDGDLDVLHELRVVHNDGGNTWSAGADLGAQLPADAIGLVPLDFDHDGRADVVCWSTASPVRLLRSTGATFVDVTTAHLPVLVGVRAITAGDVDRDGDADLLLNVAGGADLLRNDAGTFVRLQNVGPPGVLVDMDRDLDADLFDGVRIHHNRHCQLCAPRLPTLGADYRLDVHTWRTGTPVAFGWLAMAASTGFYNAPQGGIVRVDVTQAFAVPMVLPGGTGSLLVPIPRAVPLLGVDLVFQALVLDPSGLSIAGSNHLLETIR